MFTRRDIIDLSVRMGCKKDLTQKGMVVSPYGDVICIATLSGAYPDGIYYANNQKSPKEIRYCGVYAINAPDRLYAGNSETRKNIAVTRTDGIDKFVYFFEKTAVYSKMYFFHGRYKYVRHKFIESNDLDHENEILFHLVFVDKPF